ncbi:hypothetical protein NMG60_11029297 [Bertholletia excelsa]
MQAIKDKINDMKEMQKVKAEIKAEEKAEKDLAKARTDIAHEMRLAKEAEAEMELHVAKAGRRVDREIAKQADNQSLQSNRNLNTAVTDNEAHAHAQNPSSTTTIITTTTNSTTGVGNASKMAAAPPKDKIM